MSSPTIAEHIAAIKKLRGGQPVGPFRQGNGEIHSAKVYETAFATPFCVCGESISGTAEHSAAIIVELLNAALK